MHKKIKNKKIKNDYNAFNQAIITWRAPEYLEHSRGPVWKIMALIIILISAAVGFYLRAWTFSLAIMAFAVVYYQLHREKPQIVDVVISKIGIKVGKNYYPFSKIRGFWLNYEPPHVKTLYIRVSNHFLLDIGIQLNLQNPAVVRDVLISLIPEIENQNEHFTDTFARLFKL